MTDDRPWFLTLKLPSADRATIEAWGDALRRGRATVLAAATADAVEALEPGTRHGGLVIARFFQEADLRDFWRGDGRPRPAPHQTALACAGLPWEGWPGHDVPTIATVTVPAADPPRALMLIEGTGTDTDRMDRYRDIILPMMRDRGAYYIAFELGGNVEVLAGEWLEGIFAISRWPARAAAHDFWFSERYQHIAIPIRTGVGRFDVQLTEGLAG